MNKVFLRSPRVTPAPSRVVAPAETTDPWAGVWDRIWAQRGPIVTLIALAREGMHALHRAVLLPYLTPDTRLLELGCGPATLTLSVAHRIQELVGLDSSDEALRQAWENQQRLGIANARFVHADCRAVPFCDAFDVTWSAGLIEHFFEHDIDVVHQHLRATQPGGIVLLSVPAKYSLHHLHYLLTRPKVFRRFWPWSEVRRFQKFYSPRQLTQVAKATGQVPHVFYLPPRIVGFLLGILILQIVKPPLIPDEHA